MISKHSGSAAPGTVGPAPAESENGAGASVFSDTAPVAPMTYVELGVKAVAVHVAAPLTTRYRNAVDRFPTPVPENVAAFSSTEAAEDPSSVRNWTGA